MSYFFIVAAALCAWAILRVLGGEREYRLSEVRARVAVEQARAARESPPAAKG